MKQSSILKTSTLLKGIIIMPTMALVLLTVSVNAQNRPVPPAPIPPTASTTQSGKKIYEVVEVLPQFPGGMDKFGKFLGENLRYPAADREKNLQGKVITQFVVEADGSLTDIKVIRSPSDAMAAEAVRVLGVSPKWKPGILDGKIVAARYTVPINFTLGM